MGIYEHNVNPNAFVRFMRHVYNPIGFNKGYNFTLFFIFAGALLGFSLARASYLNVDRIYLTSAAPGEAYWYRQHWYNIGIHIHLICIVPAGMLAIIQFIPVVRHKLLLLHRINGYIVILLLSVANIGALLIVRRAFGGTIATQAGVGVLAITTTGSALMAYINIKRLQIEQHRAWMLRCWFYAGSIITLRIIMIIAVQIISKIGSYYIAMSCLQIAGSGGQVGRYAACRADPEGYVAVHAVFGANAHGVEEVAASFELTFGMAMWIAFVLHAVGVEFYLVLTPAETERLRKLSYQRQLERGFCHPGRAGLTVDRFGDAEEWKPQAKEQASGSQGVFFTPIPMENEQKLGVSAVDSGDSSRISKPASVLGWN